MRRKNAAQDMADDVPDARAVDPEQAMRGTELGELVARHVSQLPPRQREVLVLVAYEQMTSLQVAAVLEISEQNVRTNLHLARQTLKKQLAAYLDEDHCDCHRRSV
jgi:RNA polymerase sigma-70 factor (ECF subfamily)